MRRITCALATIAMFSVAVGAQSPTEIDSLKSWAADVSKRLRSRPDNLQAGCYVDAYLGHMVVRSNDPHLHQGDRVTSVGATKIGDADDVVKLVRALAPNGTVLFGLVRNGKATSVTIQCRNTVDVMAVRIGAVDAAAAGDLEKCITESGRFGREYVQSAGMYLLWRRCNLAAGKLSDISRWSTLVEYWTLELQQLRQSPSQLESARARYLTALTEIVNAGQPVLADELRKQWAIASGEPTTASARIPVPRAPTPQRVLPPRATVGTAPHRSARSNCESGHWIDSVTDDGSVIKLEDGSLWKVDDADIVDSALWLPTTDIVVCDGKLINTEDNESVGARRIE